jgi:hypothetical protein
VGAGLNFGRLCIQTYRQWSDCGLLSGKRKQEQEQQEQHEQHEQHEQQEQQQQHYSFLKLWAKRLVKCNAC